MQPWLDLLMKYGWQPLLAVCICWFLYKELWPWLKKRADDRETERRERELASREQLAKLTAVMESTVLVNERLANEVRSNGGKMDELHAAFKELRLVWFKKQQKPE